MGKRGIEQLLNFIIKCYDERKIKSFKETVLTIDWPWAKIVLFVLLFLSRLFYGDIKNHDIVDF